MLGFFKKFLLTRLNGHCPRCGSSRVSVKTSRSLPFVTDGATVAEYTCQACHHTWRIPIRVGP